jgi:hypothetical protein
MQYYLANASERNRTQKTFFNVIVIIQNLEARRVLQKSLKMLLLLLMMMTFKNGTHSGHKITLTKKSAYHI